MSTRALRLGLAAALTITFLAHTQPVRTQGFAPRIAGDMNTLAEKGLLAESDEDFLKHAIRSSAIELQAARLAMTKSSSADVKAFAESLVNDHTESAKELAQWATK